MNPKEKLHGSPSYYKLLEEMKETHNKKSHDYASDDNPSGNYHFAGRLALLFSHSEQDAGFIGRIGEKIYRLANLEKGSKTPLNESIEDTERDIAVITALWMADRRQRREQQADGYREVAYASGENEALSILQIMIKQADELTTHQLIQLTHYLTSLYLSKIFKGEANVE